MTMRRLALMFRRGRLDDELRDEVALHLELRRQARWRFARSCTPCWRVPSRSERGKLVSG